MRKRSISSIPHASPPRSPAALSQQNEAGRLTCAGLSLSLAGGLAGVLVAGNIEGWGAQSPAISDDCTVDQVVHAADTHGGGGGGSVQVRWLAGSGLPPAAARWAWPRPPRPAALTVQPVHPSRTGFALSAPPSPEPPKPRVRVRDSTCVRGPDRQTRDRRRQLKRVRPPGVHGAHAELVEGGSLTNLGQHSGPPAAAACCLLPAASCLLPPASCLLGSFLHV